jgi:hypothetical protein
MLPSGWIRKTRCALQAPRTVIEEAQKGKDEGREGRRKSKKAKVKEGAGARSFFNFCLFTFAFSYSTVTDLARFLGWSTSQPRRTAM